MGPTRSFTVEAMKLAQQSIQRMSALLIYLSLVAYMKSTSAFMGILLLSTASRVFWGRSCMCSLMPQS